MNDPNTPECSGIYNITSEDERSLYLKVDNCGFDKPGIEEEVIESLPLLHFQTLLRTKIRKNAMKWY